MSQASVTGTRNSDLTRERLITTALPVFSVAGFDGTSARQIERIAGVERGLIAYHFGSKLQLWKAAVDSLFARFGAEHLALREALRDVSRRERARAMLMAYARFNALNPEFFRILVLEGHQTTERSEHIAGHLRKYVGVYREFTDTYGPTETHNAMAIYLIMGAAGTLSATSAYHEALAVDASSADFVDRFATAVAAMGFHGAEESADSAVPLEAG